MKCTLLTHNHFFFFVLELVVTFFLFAVYSFGRYFLAMRLGCTLFTSTDFFAGVYNFGMGLLS